MNILFVRFWLLSSNNLILNSNINWEKFIKFPLNDRIGFSCELKFFSNVWNVLFYCCFFFVLIGNYFLIDKENCILQLVMDEMCWWCTRIQPKKAARCYSGTRNAIIRCGLVKSQVGTKKIGQWDALSLLLLPVGLMWLQRSVWKDNFLFYFSFHRIFPPIRLEKSARGWNIAKRHGQS